ncbi:ectonucleoside triphosphate diphosphohydrolase 6 isoform X1 [Onychostruthus taczanowskii]|uniref:ectonucleoside triphosphate diphosphohydrolase 6 isoform X1 n=2 Tax=Onychostruthus taczanowskii TaxID=356909 RepID=UPI001B800C90|nr:ectonucleoside triphosphate diphosphohydrolase 6 isoform X1 [Onychostruthus taczanowskii]XP_041280095.1 ectonucleoside triphosphate diphosphohydrolase 6 isoform X2 [Onychostruthus taczanowskii]XP_041280096.1 ectonucleoside triphosphate diphosphohydrolase 6 isoform X1 [Onychostruthus taczanowskii]XP_041280097.1 ectonucleoside triphosphate diphosphohydrolase 6 isoform X1 [Onychostruthus taczanowskii]
MEAMKISKRFFAFGILTCIAVYVAYVKWHLGSKSFVGATEGVAESRGDKLTHQAVTTDLSVFYGIMFDAGSTGTRIHIFKFAQQPRETPRLTHETFKALKPGLSAYADDVEKSGHGIKELLEVAKKEVPMELWKFTPLVLKATAGLRLLPGEKAQKLLEKVKEIFQASPFFVRDNCVSIMNGTDEGISAWITINFLTGRLDDPQRRSVGMLDLGGGSTQITFLPRTKATLQTSPSGHTTSFQMFNHTYKLYSYSYLGLGLMSARLAILGGVEGKPLGEGEELISPCLPPGFNSEWQHAEIVYKIKGQKAGEPLYESCSNKVAKMLYKKVHRAGEVKDLDFYIFSYYYDCAAEAGLIDKEKGGSLTVSDFEIAAKYVCKTMEISPGNNPFLCMDLTYITFLLQELGFPKSQSFKLARKIDNVETSWALGATFHYIDSLNRLQY